MRSTIRVSLGRGMYQLFEMMSERISGGSLSGCNAPDEGAENVQDDRC
jgi:hypothetical protein